MQRIKEEFNKEKEKREEFEENVLIILDDSVTKMVYNSEN